MSKEPLWASGPGEILRHGVELLKEDNDTNRRLALISIDNSVELMLQTYITLPTRVTGLSISRKEREEICKNFPSLLDGIESYAEEKTIGLSLGEIEWFHRLRNNLYHEGNGLTVVRTHVEVYAELAQKLFESLFGVKLKISNTENINKLGEFMDIWISMERSLVNISPSKRGYIPMIINDMLTEGLITIKQANKINELRVIRNNLVHGKSKPEKVLTKNLLENARKTVETLNDIVR